MENSAPSSYLGGSASHALTTGDHTLEVDVNATTSFFCPFFMCV